MFVGLVMTGLAVWLFRTICRDIKNEKNVNQLCLPLVLLCGIFSGLWEPQAVFSSVNWWCLWWFALGVYIARKRYINDNDELTNDVGYHQIE